MGFRPINAFYIRLEILTRSVFYSCLRTIFVAYRLERLERA